MKDIVSKVPDAQVMGDLDSTVAFAKGEGKADTAKLGITGFCWGGRIVWMYDAHNPAVKAGVAWYGPLAKDAHAAVADAIRSTSSGACMVRCRASTAAPTPASASDSVEKMRAALKAGSPAAQKSQIKVYPDTPHGFNADYRPSFRKERRRTAGSSPRLVQGERRRLIAPWPKRSASRRGRA